MFFLKYVIDRFSKRAACAGLAAVMAVTSLAVNSAGCGGKSAGGGRLKVAADIAPLADFCVQLGGDLVEVRALVPAGATPHAYELSTAQVRFLEEADLLVVSGLGLTPWAEDVFARAGGPGMVRVAAGEAVPASELILVSGHEGVYDPHVWLDPALAVYIVEAIRDGLCEADPENAPFFQENSERYIRRLIDLDTRIAAEVASFTTRRFISFHSSWTYFARRYGLEQAGVIEEQPGKEPSAGEIAGLVEMARDLGIRVVFAEPQFSTRVAETIAEESGGAMTVRLLDPLGDPGDPRKDTYLEMMDDNLAIMGEVMK